MFQFFDSLTYRYKIDDREELRERLLINMYEELIFNNEDSELLTKTEVIYYLLDKVKSYHKWSGIYKICALISGIVFSCLFFLSILFLATLTLTFKWKVVLLIIAFGFGGVFINFIENILYTKSWNSSIMESQCEELMIDYNNRESEL